MLFRSVEFETIMSVRGLMAQNVRHPGEKIDPNFLKPQLPNPYVQSFSAPTVRQLEYEVNEQSAAMNQQIRSVSLTPSLDGKGYIMVAVFEEFLSIKD